MERLATGLVELVTQYQNYVYVLGIAAIFICGIMLIIPSQDSKSAAKKALPWVIVGIVLALGCVYVVNDVTRAWSF